MSEITGSTYSRGAPHWGGATWGPAHRAAALNRYSAHDLPPDIVFHDLAQLAAHALSTPIAVIHLIGPDHQWFYNEDGPGGRDTIIPSAICARVPLRSGLTVLPDLSQVPAFDGHPMVYGFRQRRFYAGVLLETPDGVPLGSIYVLDSLPRPQKISVAEGFALQALARQVMAQLALHRSIAESRRSEAELIISQARLSAIFAQAAVGLAEVDLQGRFRMVNDAFSRIIGRTEDEARATSIWQITPDDDMAFSKDIFERVVLLGKSSPIDKRYSRPDGTLVWVNVSLTRLDDERGQPRAVLAVAVDISERKAAADRLAVSEESRRLAMEAAEVATWDIDLSTNKMSYSARLKPMFGILSDEHCDREAMQACVHLEDRPFANEAFAQAVDPVERAAYDVEYRTIGRDDGILRWVAAKGRGVFDEQGKCVRAIGTIVDITARKVAEERLRASERELRNLNETLEQRVDARTKERDRTWDNAQDLIAVIGADGVFRAANPAWYKLLGWRPEEVVGRSYLEFGHPENGPPHEPRPESSNASMLGHENRCLCKDGSYRWISWMATQADGLIYASGRDITAEKQRQAKLEAAEDQLRQAQKIEAIGQLTGGIAHDFNNLLMVFSGGLTLLDRQTDPARRQQTVDAMRKAVDRGSGLTRQLLTFSRRQTLNPEPIDLTRQISSMRELLDRSLGGNIQLDTDFSADLWPVEVDAGEMELALLNLCVNARDAMPTGGTITISAKNLMGGRGDLSCDLVCVSVADHGSGMPPEVLQRIFEPFFTTKDVGKGSGLGLPQVYGFAQQSGGIVEVESAVGQGTTVSLYLPRSFDEPVQVDKSANGQNGDEDDDVSRGTVLLVEDDQEVATLVTEMLKQLGYDVVRAASGEAALGALANNRQIDLVFSDVMMPGGMNGIELAREISRRNPGLGVLLTSGYAETTQREPLPQGVELLPKPYKLDALATALGRVQATRA